MHGKITREYSTREIPVAPRDFTGELDKLVGRHVAIAPFYNSDNLEHSMLRVHGKLTSARTSTNRKIYQVNGKEADNFWVFTSIEVSAIDGLFIKLW